MKNLKLFSFFLSLLFLTCCDKSTNSMEPCINCPTNIFQCKINGKDWKSDCIPDPLFGCNSISITFDAQEHRLEIVGSNESLKNGFNLNASNVYNNQDCIILKNLSGYSDRSNSGCINYEVDTSNNVSRLLCTSLDEVGRTIKLSFYSLFTNSCGDSIKVTNGLINMKY